MAKVIGLATMVATMAWLTAFFAGQTKEGSGSLQGIGQRAGRGWRGVGCLLGIHTLGSSLPDDASGIAEDDLRDAHGLDQGGADDSRCAGTVYVYHHPHLFQPPPGQMTGIEGEESRRGNDGCVMLIIVGNGVVHQRAQAGFDFQVDGIDIGKALEQDRLAFHDRLAGEGTEIAQSQNGGATGNYCHQIAFRSVVVGKRRVLVDSSAGPGHAR